MNTDFAFAHLEARRAALTGIAATPRRTRPTSSARPVARRAIVRLPLRLARGLH